ncbi:MAG: Ig-like domain-containing protein, partial [[Clostridium] scindens]|uniref:Ig-like domain-containing protein n=1 Tax=Clostridium scindens (strain JCM 10418 / VPI 12708) TaxID=29347 RepID=UPI002B22186F
MRKQLKRWLAAVLCAALLLPSMARAAETMEGTVATFSEEGNLTAYGSFEADQVITDTTDPNYAVLQDAKLAGKTMADFWPQGRTYPVYYEADSSNGKGSVVFTYDTENKVDGNQSLRITMVGANRYIIFRATGPLTSGTKYRVSYRYKTETLSTTATNNSYVPLIRREFADSAWTVVAADRVLIGNLATGTNNWQQITQEFTTPASGRPNFQLVLQVANHAAGNLTTGTLWLDDLRLEEVVPPVAVSLDKTSLALKTGETSQLTATVTNAADSAVTWTSSDAAVASVSAAGLVAAVAAGNATITANSVQDSTKSAVCTVNVTAPPEPGVAKMRVGTFNIAAVKKLPIAAQAALVDANQIDLVGLQEVDVNTTRRPTDMLADFAAAGSQKNTYFQKAIDMTDGHGVYGIGIASKLPLTGTGGASLYSETGAEGRAYARAVVTVEGKQIAIYNTHLSWESNVALATRLRGEQIKQIIAAVKADPTPYKVITGDFNIDQTRGEWYPFLEEFDMANGGDGTWYPTFNGVDSTMKVMDIDNIITTRNIKVENVTMVDTKTANVSDHNLLYADLTVLDQEQPSKQLLNLLVGDAEKLVADDYTTASFAAVTTAVNAAKALAADADQTVIDTAVATLRVAVAALVSNPN